MDDYIFCKIASGKITGLRVYEDENALAFHFHIHIIPRKDKDGIDTIRLETPVWNSRTNSFYKKLGYTEMYRNEESVFYQKNIEKCRLQLWMNRNYVDLAEL